MEEGREGESKDGRRKEIETQAQLVKVHGKLHCTILWGHK